MTPTKLQELLALREKATPEPWSVYEDTRASASIEGPEGHLLSFEEYSQTDADAAFIVAAHAAIPSIAEEMAAKDARIAELEKVAQAAKRVDDMRVFGFGEYQHLNPHEDEAQALEAVRVALSALSHGGDQ